ncbi:vesicle coat protein [Helicostylum pulchrum]|nr:vesicle coat protein [Helicostylum pulchrum]
MNALIALLHFCEVHGPCVVYCTQTIHQAHTLSAADLNIPALKSMPLETETAPLPPIRKNSLSNTPQKISPGACAACTAQLPLVNTGQIVTEAKSLFTLDQDDASIKYIGTKSPQQNHLYKAVRLACVRSLTAEFCQGRDGPVLFGDDENGYVMSYMFKLRDSQARGEARFYSLMMLMTDRVYLISCWPFLVSAFRSMALNLQERANIVFQKEKEGNRHQSITRRTPISSQDPFFRRKSNTALRSLVDLLGVKDIYAQIQAQFSYTLKLSSRKRMEKLCMGRTESPVYKRMKAEYQAKKDKRLQQQQQQQQLRK